MNYAKELNFNEISQFLEYEKESGKLRWIKNFHYSRVGKVAGHQRKNGYVYVKLNGELHHAARLAWLLSHGSIDNTKQIDHINRIPSDNRLSNLRLVNGTENCINRKTCIGEESPRYYTRLKNGSFQVQVRGKYIGLAKTESKATELAQTAFKGMK
jgi:hypothetical protein